MEAASGGYHEVGKVLINKGADVNAAPVPSSKDTALTIAADKGHYKFVDLILRFGAHVDVKNKKGNSPLWLAANGGHLDVVRLLVEYKADVDSQDNRRGSCLMAAFRKVLGDYFPSSEVGMCFVIHTCVRIEMCWLCLGQLHRPFLCRVSLFGFFLTLYFCRFVPMRYFLPSVIKSLN